MKVIYLTGTNVYDLQTKINALEGQWRLVNVYKNQDIVVAWLQEIA